MLKHAISQNKAKYRICEMKNGLYTCWKKSNQNGWAPISLKANVHERYQIENNVCTYFPTRESAKQELEKAIAYFENEINKEIIVNYEYFE